MLPVFFVEEITVRESGESAVFDMHEHAAQNLLLTFGITHAVEQESIAIAIHDSVDGLAWSLRPIASFAPKSYCGTYQLILPQSGARFLKATWSVARWSPGGHRPYFRFYVFAQPAVARARVAGAA